MRGLQLEFLCASEKDNFLLMIRFTLGYQCAVCKPHRVPYAVNLPRREITARQYLLIWFHLTQPDWFINKWGIHVASLEQQSALSYLPKGETCVKYLKVRYGHFK